MKRLEWMCAGAMSVALLLGAGCQSAQAKTPEGAQTTQATGGSGAAGQQGERKVTYKLEAYQPGQPTANLVLTFAPGGKKVTGTGTIQANSSQPSVMTEIQGDVTQAAKLDHPDQLNTVVDATGHVPSNPHISGGPGPAVPENFKLQLVISPDGASGMGLYQYQPKKGDAWVKVEPVKVERVGAQ
jgi:hypothetical protein